MLKGITLALFFLAALAALLAAFQPDWITLDRVRLVALSLAFGWAGELVGRLP